MSNLNIGLKGKATLNSSSDMLCTLATTFHSNRSKIQMHYNSTKVDQNMLAMGGATSKYWSLIAWVGYIDVIQPSSCIPCIKEELTWITMLSFNLYGDRCILLNGKSLKQAAL